MTNKKQAKPVQSVQRALAVLEAVAQRPEGVALRDIARTTGLKPPTAFFLAETLVGRGYLRKCREPIRYLVGPAVGHLLGHGEADQWRRRAETAVAALARRFPAATVTCSELSGNEAAVRLRMSPDQPGLLQRPRDRVLSPYTSASGLLLQALAPAELLAAYRRNYPFAEYGASRWRTEKRLTAFLDRARRAGRVVLDRPDKPAGLLCLAVPVAGRPTATPTALGMSLPEGEAESADPEKLAATMVEALRRATAEGLATHHQSSET